MTIKTHLETSEREPNDDELNELKTLLTDIENELQNIDANHVIRDPLLDYDPKGKKVIF